MRRIRSLGYKSNRGSKLFVVFVIAIALAFSIGWGVMAERAVPRPDVVATPCLGPGFTPGFTAAPDFPVGSVPNSIAIDDFNGDGIPDMAIANRSPNNNVSIRLGNGSGGFTSPSTPQVAVGSDPVSIAVGDFNGDGKADFVTANQNSNNVSIRFGNGSGGFTSPVVPEIAVGTSPTYVGVGDFNRDGHQEFAVIGKNTSTLPTTPGDFAYSSTVALVADLYIQNEDGTFKKVGHFSFTDADINTLLRTGKYNDVDGDGIFDIVIPFSEPPKSTRLAVSSSVAVLLGDGVGGFKSPAPTPVPFNYEVESVALADFNSDGKPDLLATGAAAGGRVSIRLGDGTGGFTPAAIPEVTVETGSYLLEVADFNGDGKMDFATGNDSTLSIRLGNGAGGFTSPSVPEIQVGLIVGALAIGDFNLDGRPDLAAVVNDPNGTSHVAVRLGNCTSTTATPTPTPTATPTPTPTPTPVPSGTPTLDTTFNPNTNGEIYAIVVQTDGKIIIGGAFTTVAPNGGAVVTRNRIARFNSDGTLDAAFDPNASNIVFAIALQPDGKILAGGLFQNIGGQARGGIARLDSTGLSESSFNPGFGGTISTIAMQPDGKVLIGGFFSNIGGQARNNIARLDATTGLADAFNPHANNGVDAIAVQSDGRILVGGEFTNIGGTARSRFARLSAATGVADTFDPNPNSSVFAMALQPDGKIVIGGAFTSVSNQTRNRIARLDPVTGIADAFDPNLTNNIVQGIAVEADGHILAGARSAIGTSGDRAVRINADGTLTAFDLKPNDRVDSVAVQPNGSFLVGGAFTNIAGQPRGGIARFGVPVPAVVSVSGRILTPDGRGLRNAGVVITDSAGNSRTATTSSFGFYSFDNLTAGGQYVIRISSRQYRFATRSLQVTETLSNIDFVGLE